MLESSELLFCTVQHFLFISVLLPRTRNTQTQTHTIILVNMEPVKFSLVSKSNKPQKRNAPDPEDRKDYITGVSENVLMRY